MNNDARLEEMLVGLECGMEALAMLPANRFQVPPDEALIDYRQCLDEQCRLLAHVGKFEVALSLARQHLDVIRPSDYRLNFELSTGEIREFFRPTAVETLFVATQYLRRLASSVVPGDSRAIEYMNTHTFDQWEFERCVNAALAEVRHVEAVRKSTQSNESAIPQPQPKTKTSTSSETIHPDDYKYDGNWLTALYCQQRFDLDDSSLSNWATGGCPKLDGRELRRAKFPPDQKRWCYHRGDIEDLVRAISPDE